MGRDEGCPAPLEFTTSDGTKVSLYGTIDRVDTYEHDGKVYVRVVDYKTFGKSFKLSDIQKGVNLQLLIYLFTLWKGGRSKFRSNLAPHGEEILPAGMIYLSSAPDSATSSVPVGAEEAAALAASTIGRSGVLLDDEASLAAMGSALGGKYIPSRKTELFALERFGALYDEIESVIVGIAEEIKSGKCASRPRKLTSYHPCDYCKMKPVCRHIEGRRDDDEQ
jgi:ATP-dependent helicase/nuclease subunit B